MSLIERELELLRKIETLVVERQAMQAEIDRLREALIETRSVLISTYETHRRARDMVPDEEEGLAAQVFAKAINHADHPIIEAIARIDVALSGEKL